MTEDTVVEGKLLSMEEANQLVLEHQGWAESIARSVARAWNLDWKLDGLDGAAMEALIFCSRRFNPTLGVPFRGYARKRIHEASTEAAKKSKGWRKGFGVTKEQQQSRDISAELMQIFPETREGYLPVSYDERGGEENDMRGSIRQMLVGATLIASRHIAENPSPDDLIDMKRMLNILITLDPVHQLLLWRIYWDGLSLRNLAAEWKTDGLNVIREHKILVEYLYKNLSLGKQFLHIPKTRPGLRDKASELKKTDSKGPFSEIFEKRGYSS